MNDIQVIDKQIADINERAMYLKTEQGKNEMAMRFLEIFAALQAYGYRLPDSEKEMMAKIWVVALQDYIALYGINKVKQAIIYLVTTDEREYKTFPKPVELIDGIKKVGGRDPRAIKAEMLHEERKRKMEMETKSDLSKTWDEKPQEWKDKATSKFGKIDLSFIKGV